MHGTHVCTHIYGEGDIPRQNIYISVKKKALVKNNMVNKSAINQSSPASTILVLTILLK